MLVAVIWAGSSVLIQYIYDDLDFNSPFMVTYLATTLLGLYIPLWQLWILLGFITNPPLLFNRGSNGVSTSNNDMNDDEKDLKYVENILQSSYQTSSSADVENSGHGGIKSNSTSSSEDSAHSVKSDDALSPSKHGNHGGEVEVVVSAVPRRVDLSNESSASKREHIEGAEGIARTNYTHLEALKAAMYVAPMWFLANCLYNYSLYMTSVSSSTIISNLAASFTLAFSAYAGFEKVSLVKVVGIAVCFGGAILIGLSDSGDGHTIRGDVIALMSAAAYGIYTTIIRLKVPDDNGISMQLLLGYIGVVNGIILLPVTLSLVSQ